VAILTRQIYPTVTQATYFGGGSRALGTLAAGLRELRR
jgi:hypothetical protein